MKWNPSQIIGVDLALHPSTLMSWIHQDVWTGEPVESSDPGSGQLYRMIRPGVALLQYDGVIANHECWWGRNLLYDWLERGVIEALSDLAVGSLVVQLETPGGVTAGGLNICARLRRIIAARGIPVFVHAQGQMLSMGSFLAQSLAGAGGMITAEPTASVGQMGVYRILTFIGLALEKEGIQIRYVSAGAHKIDLFPEQDPSDEALTRLQGQIDRVYEALCRDAGIGLALRRGITPDEGYQLIRGQESLTYTGEQEAVDVGAIDRVALLDEVIEMAASMAA